MPRTKTGSFPIGFRRSRSAWQQDVESFIAFAKRGGFSFVDTGPADPAELKRIKDSGLELGTVDLKQWADLASPDALVRSAAIEANARHVEAARALGVYTFLAVMAMAEPSRPRGENFGFAMDGWERLLSLLEPMGTKVVLEGWPGPAPYFGSFGCTPADCRAIFKAIDSKALGINYDPSHLVRMRIDPLRFLTEFASRVLHVHAKDTTFVEEEEYEHGSLQPATFASPHRWGGHSWRYSLPGRGRVPWRPMIEALVEARYSGKISIEMEDELFAATEQEEKQGLLLARDFLAAL